MGVTVGVYVAVYVEVNVGSFVLVGMGVMVGVVRCGGNGGGRVF